MASFLKNGMTLLGLALIAGLGYYLFFMQSDSNVSLDSETTIDEARIASEQFLKELENLQSIQFSNTLFGDQRFRSLVDFTRPIPSQPVGRSNPFEPVN